MELLVILYLNKIDFYVINFFLHKNKQIIHVLSSTTSKQSGNEMEHMCINSEKLKIF